MGYVVNSLALVDKTTGEVVEDRVVIFGKKPTDTGFIKVFVTFLEDLVMDEAIVGKAIRLLLYAIKRVDWNSLEVYLFYATVCNELNISYKTYFKWLKDLINSGYIEPTPSKYIYKLKPYSFVRGSMEQVKC